MAVLSIVKAQLSLQKQKIAKEPQKHGNAKKPAAYYEPARSDSELHDPVDSQRQS